MRRLPSILFSAARATPCGVLPPHFRHQKTVIQTGFCTFALHSFYTAKMCGIMWNKISNFQKVSHPLRMTSSESVG
jgi:hypothetical protein